MVTAAQVAQARAALEGQMTDSCVIGAAAEQVWDEATGAYVPGVSTPVYSGKCRYRAGNTSVHEVDAQGQPLIEQSDVLNLPVAGSEGVLKDMVAVVTLSLDPTAPFTVRVTGGHRQTFSTARRLPVELVS